jgi:hypothetical protein
MALQLPRITARPGSFGRRATGEDFGAAEGQARAQGAGVFSALSEASERILMARESARASRALAAASVELEQNIEALRDDPDEATHEERFEKARAEIQSRHEKTLFGPWRGEFADRFGIEGVRAGAQVRDQVRARRVSAGRADTQAALADWANLYGRAAEPNRGPLMERAAEAIGRAQGAGLFSAEQAQGELERFKATATEGLWRAGKDRDPQGTLEAVRARVGGFEHMDEPRRQVAIEALEAEIAQRERFAKAEKAEAEARVLETRRQLEEATARQGMAQVLDGSISVGWIRQNLPNLSRTEADYFLGETRRTGPSKTGIQDMAEWRRLVDLRYDAPEQFAQEKIDPAKVGPVEYEKLKEAQAKARRGESASPSEVRTVARERAKLRADLSELEQAELQRSYEAALEDFEKQKNGQASAKEQQSVMDAIELQRYRGDPWGPGGAYLQPEGTPIVVPGLSAAVVDFVTRDLNAQGVRVTPEAILARARELASEQ